LQTGNISTNVMKTHKYNAQNTEEKSACQSPSDLQRERKVWKPVVKDRLLSEKDRLLSEKQQILM